MRLARTLSWALLAAVLVLAPVAAQGDSEAPDCPTDLAGYPPETGGVFMSWTLRSNTDVVVHRAVGDGEFTPIARLEFPATRHIDHDTEPRRTYRYQVTAVDEEGRESPACGTLEVTTVPDIGTVAGASAAMALGLLGYAWARRK